jgi:hypothetical protein
VSAEELARRAVACKGWRWMPGMRLAGCEPFATVFAVRNRDEPGSADLDIHYAWTHDEDEHATDADYAESELPDLADPATLGCLLALVREAWGDPSAVTSPDGVTWGVHVSTASARQVVAGWDTMVSIEDTESEALVAALEAAP